MLLPLEGYLRRMAGAILGDPHEAQDALQEALLSALVARDQLRDTRFFKPWLKKIVAHQCGRHLKKRAQIVPIGRSDSYIFDKSVCPGEDLLIWEVVAGLPQHLGQIVTLRYAGDLKQTEIADLLEIPVGTVKSRLHTALTRLRELMDDAKGGTNHEMS